MRLKDILRGVNAEISGYENLEITGISINSREVKKGDLFIALKGFKSDGNDYIGEAAAGGAVAVLTACHRQDIMIPTITAQDMPAALSAAACNFYGDPSSKLDVTGITGTKGKTTSSYILEAMLKASGKNVGIIGTINYRTHKRVISEASNTTPLAPELNRLLVEMSNDGCSHCVIEVSSHSLALKRVDDIKFDSAIFTNLQSDHLDFHKNNEEYARAKAHLFELLAASPKKEKKAILNADEYFSSELARISGNNVSYFTYGLGEEADLKAENLLIKPDGTDFRIRKDGKSVNFSIKLIGKHNVYNTLAAAALLYSRGISLEKIAEAASRTDNVPGRLEKIISSKNFSVYIDYAHTEESLRSVLVTLGNIPHKRIITIFGCGGDRDATKRAPMGIVACSLSDMVIVTSDNPRSEDPESIIADIEAGIKGKFSNYELVPSREEAIHRGIMTAMSGDLILIAGKGHEDYQILREKTVHFNDRETAIRFMKAAGKL